ncbi:hypothetical protein HK096_011221, partial [Nowakowskiella sp. JEL0078]
MDKKFLSSGVNQVKFLAKNVVPAIFSQRFQHRLSARPSIARTQEHTANLIIVSDNNIHSNPTQPLPPIIPKLPNSLKPPSHNPRISATNVRAPSAVTHSHESTKLDSVATESTIALSKIGSKCQPSDDSNVSVEPYTPFPLQTSSSFNPLRLSKKQLRNLDRLTMSKYNAYATPDKEVVARIEESGKRVKGRQRRSRKELGRQIEEARKLWEKRKGLASGDDTAAKEGARKARERMELKAKCAEAAKDAELQFLVEGQRSSIDAIRLKEYLTLKTSKFNLGFYSEKDKLRVQ